ncbi:MAG: hypothetical protein LBT59_14740 [Clostridiales bacterium]|nr:hypothetical protein [Clostridiales bacterium]
MVCPKCSLESFHNAYFCSRCGMSLRTGHLPCIESVSASRNVSDWRLDSKGQNDSRFQREGLPADGKGSPTGDAGTKILLIIVFFILIWLFMR